MGAYFASCAYTCNQCICPCCYPWLTGGKLGKTDQNLYTDPLALVVYDKWCKEDIVYKHRELVFEHISKATDGGRIQSIEEEKMDEDLVILDFGCGTGIYAEILNEKFVSDSRDTLLFMDLSPQCIQFVRNNVIENSRKFQYTHVEYYCNDPDTLSLCHFCAYTRVFVILFTLYSLDNLDNKYDDNGIDVILMAFVLRYISKKNGDRDSIMKELFKACKVGGTFVVFEVSEQFIAQRAEQHGHKIHDEQRPLMNEEERMEGFKSCDDLVGYIEGFGFQLQERIMEDVFHDNQWILLFRKPRGP